MAYVGTKKVIRFCMSDTALWRVYKRTCSQKLTGLKPSFFTFIYFEYIKNPLKCGWEVFQFLEQNSNIMDVFEFIKHLQVIIGTNIIFWCWTMPKDKILQKLHHFFVLLTCTEKMVYFFCNVSTLEQEKIYKTPSY